MRLCDLSNAKLHKPTKHLIMGADNTYGETNFNPDPFGYRAFLAEQKRIDKYIRDWLETEKYNKINSFT